MAFSQVKTQQMPLRKWGRWQLQSSTFASLGLARGSAGSYCKSKQNPWSFDQHCLVLDDISRRKQCTNVTYFAFVQQLCKETDMGISVDAFGLCCADVLV